MELKQQGQSGKGKSNFRSLIENEYIIEARKRLWKLDTYLDVYSVTADEWFTGKIINVAHDDWLLIEFLNVDKRWTEKELHRLSPDLRPRSYDSKMSDRRFKKELRYIEQDNHQNMMFQSELLMAVGARNCKKYQQALIDAQRQIATANESLIKCQQQMDINNDRIKDLNEEIINLKNKLQFTEMRFGYTQIELQKSEWTQGSLKSELLDIKSELIDTKQELHLLKEWKQTKQQEEECVVCMDGQSEFACVPCGHKCLCTRCRDVMNGPCPICNKPFDLVIKIYN